MPRLIYLNKNKKFKGLSAVIVISPLRINFGPGLDILCYMSPYETVCGIVAEKYFEMSSADISITRTKT